MADQVIVLGGREHKFRAPFTFARLRRITVAYPKVLNKSLSENEMLDALAEVFSAVLEIPVEDVANLDMTIHDLMPALDIIAFTAGMVAKDSPEGEAQAGKV